MPREATAHNPLVLTKYYRAAIVKWVAESQQLISIIENEELDED
jgi:hypothetical protein